MKNLTSTLAADGRTTVPRAVRQALGLRPEDALVWEVADAGRVMVRPATPEIFQHAGAVKVGPGSAVEDVRRARRSRGKA